MIDQCGRRLWHQVMLPHHPIQESTQWSVEKKYLVIAHLTWLCTDRKWKELVLI